MHSISIIDNSTPFLHRLAVQLHSDGVKHAAGAAGRRLVQDNFRKLASERHRSGVPHNFYANAARATAYSVDDRGATVSVRHTGIAQRFWGGVIEPVNSTYLAIPARSEAQGRRPREFNNLEVLFSWSPLRPIALIERAYSRRSDRKERGGGVMYWLVDRVEQDPDPSVLPNEDHLQSTARQAASDYIARIAGR